MITKMDAKNVNVDWDYVERATEVARTYLVRDEQGREFFKMYKPSEASRIFKENRWNGTLVGKLERAVKKS